MSPKAPRRRAEGPRTPHATPHLRAVVAGLLSALALSCTATPSIAPPAELPDSFSRSGARPLPEHWWTELRDPDLDALIERALAGNFDLLTVWDRLAQSEAIARREGAPLIPSIDAQASTTRTELTASAEQGAGTRGRNDFNLGLAASYELDLWGRVRSARDAARLDAQATEQELRAAAITLSAEIARTWYALVDQRRQLDILDEQIRGNARVLELVTLRFRKGQVTAADVLRQRQLVQSSRGERFPVEAQARVLEHQLAVLVGRAPGTATLPERRRLAPLPPLPETGLPAALVEHRPDVRGAYLAVLAADRRLASARADRYPRLTLSGSAAFSAEELRDLFDNWIASVSASLLAPLIDGGRRSAEVERTRAVVSQRLHEYGQVLLDAIREVEDALVQEEQQKLLIDSLDSQLETSTAVLERIRDQYIHGTIPFLDVLQALVTHQSLERSRAAAQRRLLEVRIDLYRALGGGWLMERPSLAAIAPPEERE